MFGSIAKIDTEAVTTACLDRAPDSVPARKPRQPRFCCPDGRLGLERISRCGARLHPIAHLDNLSNRPVLEHLSATLTDRFAQGTAHSAWIEVMLIEDFHPDFHILTQVRVDLAQFGTSGNLIPDRMIPVDTVEFLNHMSRFSLFPAGDEERALVVHSGDSFVVA